MVGAALGINVVIVMPESMSIERRQLIQAYGAELILTDKSGGMALAGETAEKLRLNVMVWSLVNLQTEPM